MGIAEIKKYTGNNNMFVVLLCTPQYIKNAKNYKFWDKKSEKWFIEQGGTLTK